MKSVTVEFPVTTNINSLIVGNAGCVNGLEGTITHVINETPPDDPPVAPGDYFCSAFEVLKGNLISGSYENLHVKDRTFLTVGSEKMDGYYIVECTADFPLDGKVLPNLSLYYAGKTSRLAVDQKIYLWDFANSNWKQIDFRKVGYSIIDIFISNIANPSNYISNGLVRYRLYSYCGASFVASFDYLMLAVQ